MCGWQLMNAVFPKKSTLFFLSWLLCKWWYMLWLWTNKTLTNKVVISLISLLSLTHYFSDLPCILALSQWTIPSFYQSLTFLIWMLCLTHPFPHLTFRLWQSPTDLFCIASLSQNSCPSFQQIKSTLNQHLFPPASINSAFFSYVCVQHWCKNHDVNLLI